MALCAARAWVEGKLMGAMGEIVLPWPARELHPNSRPHWAVKRREVKRAREDAFFAAVAAGARRAEFGPGRLQVWIDGYAPDRRRRDADGLLSSLKPALDGIADAMGTDDRWFVPHPWIKDEVRKPGEVRIRITTSPPDRGAP
jgi:hypothetical protein